MRNSNTSNDPLRRRWSDKFVLTTLIIAVVIAAISAGIATFILIKYSFGNDQTIEYFNQPFPTDNLTYHRGDVISYYVQYRKYTNVPASVGKTLVCNKADGTVYRSGQLNSFGGSDKTADDISFDVVESTYGEIPKNAPLNVPCYVDIITRYDINFLRKPIVKSKTTTFSIVGNAAERQPRPDYTSPKTLPDGTPQTQDQEVTTPAVQNQNTLNVTMPQQPQTPQNDQSTVPPVNIAPEVNLSPQTTIPTTPLINLREVELVPLPNNAQTCSPLNLLCR